ncbi:isoprenyl transferase [Zavarzinia sp. CC-PAN008]|uniref:isoprenyl transferase n=1 Tax=Zavarzinia sp. CC-PAN008 TaxID=3243332 RepID=UPI003F745491
MLTAERPVPDALPRHIAIIMDGNGRWAKARHLPRAFGHRRGVEAVRRVVKAAADLGIGCLTLYAFSSENWKRPADEVSDLMGLFRLYLRRELAELHAENVRVRFIGDRSRLKADLVTLIEDSERLTVRNTGLTLVIAVNYGGRAEIVAACRRMAQDVAAGRLAPEAVDEAMFAATLQTGDLPDPDLIIRTSGEQRLSNFLLWQSAYSELVFVDTLWPDFDRAVLEQAIHDYGCRDRRFGARAV